MILDSNIIIYAAEPEYESVREFIAEQNPAASVISKIEVLGYHKMTPENQRILEEIFELLLLLPLSDDVIERAISLRQKRKISLGDALIAATALEHGMPIATANISDFNWIEDLDVVNPLFG